MSWALWLLLANGAVAVTEHTYRAAHFATFWQALPWLAVPIVIAQWALFEGFRGAPSLFVAGAVFSLCNVLFRIGNTFVLGEHLNLLNWLGVICIGASVVLLKAK